MSAFVSYIFLTASARRKSGHSDDSLAGILLQIRNFDRIYPCLGSSQHRQYRVVLKIVNTVEAWFCILQLSRIQEVLVAVSSDTVHAAVYMGVHVAVHVEACEIVLTTYHPPKAPQY